MHRITKNYIFMSKQFIACVLSVTLLFNMVAPAIAQALPTPEPNWKENFDKQYQQELNRAFARESVRIDSQYQEQYIKLSDEYYSDPIIMQLLGLQEIFLAPQKQIQEQLFGSGAQSVQAQEAAAKKQWLTQYEKEIATEAGKALSQMCKYEADQRKLMQEYAAQARAADVSNTVIEAWKQQEEQKLKEALQAYQSKVNAWRLSARKQADTLYQQELKQKAQDVHNELKQAAQELMSLYKKAPKKATPFVIEISAAILLAEGRNTDLFTDAQKQTLRHLYTQVIANDQICSSGKESFVVSCKHILNAVTSLGILGDSRAEADTIADFTEKLLETSNAVPGLLTGVSALLAMKAYSSVRGIVASATAKETKVDNLDFLSVTTWVEAAINRNGKYLGEVSKWAQFPITNNQQATAMSAVPSGNAWEEVAYMLAEEGSALALEILRKFGTDTCMVGATDHRISCAAIQPFVVGALLSGKSAPYVGVQPPLHAQWVISNQGSYYVSEQEAKHNLKTYQAAISRMKQKAAEHQISIPAEMIRSFYMSDMGDLNADEQLFLDQKLYQEFQKLTHNQQNIPEQFRLKPYNKDSEIYKSKARRAHRAQVWRVIGVVGDIAILVWCLYDLSKLGYKAVNMGRAAYKAAKMARAGVPVSARLSLLWKTGTARSLTKLNRFPARMKASIAPAVRAALPQFTHVEPLVKPINPTFLEAALSTVKVGEGGTLVVDAAKTAEKLGQSPEATGVRTAQLQTALNTAVENANTAYVNRTGLTRLMPENPWYRQQLGAEVSKIVLPSYQFGDRARLADFGYSLSRNTGILVPNNIRKASQLPLFDASGVVNMTSLRTVLDPVLRLGTTSEQRSDIMQAVRMASEQTGLEFTHRPLLSQWSGRLLRQDAKLYNELLSTNFLRLLDQPEVLSTFSADKKTMILRSLAATVHNYCNIAIPQNIGRYAAMEYTRVAENYKMVHSSLFSASGEAHALLPVEFRIDKGLASTNQYQRVIFTDKGGQYMMGLTDGLSKPVNLSNFKVDISASNMPELIRGTYQSGITTPLEIKLTPYSSQWAMRRAASLSGEMADGLSTGTTWGRNFLKSLRNKTTIWTDEIPVFIRTSTDELLPVKMVLKADTQLGLNGGKLILDSNNQLRLMRAGEDLLAGRLFHYGLPKQQITPFVNMLKTGAFDNMPLRLTVRAGRDKITPLFWTSGLSLSAASAGLITPLENTYRDRISERDKVFITFAFPYLPSILSPAIAPFVMRFGAANMLKVGLGSAVAGLAFSSAMGFRGHLDQNNLPDPWPLFVMAGLIGTSSAINRSSLNLLIDSMGGGGSLLKSMAYKNLGSIFLLAPSFLYGAYKLQVQPTLQGKTLTEKELNTPASDFSFAFPVLTGLSLGVLAWVSSARLDPNIGRASAVLKGQPFNLWKEMGPAFKMSYFAPEVLPLAAATTFFTGFESAAFSKGTNLSLKPIYERTDLVQNYVGGNRNNLTALLVGGTAALIPMGARFFAKPSLNALSNPLKPGIEYKRMLGISYGLNATGGALLMKYGLEDNPNPVDMWLGIGLMGVGTANVTQSFQKLANIRIATGATMARYTRGMDAAAAAQRAKELQTMTMAGFSWSQIGIAMIPLLQGKYVDTERDLNYKAPQGALNSLWIPMSSLGISAGLTGYGLKLFRYPTGLVGTTKLAVDGPSFLNPIPYGQKLYNWNLEHQAAQMNLKIGQTLRFEQTKAEVEAEREKARQEQLEQEKQQEISGK